METTTKFEQFAIVEVMGHSRYAGLVTEEAIGGAAFIRVDVPATDGVPAFTKYLGGGSIFAITPCSQDVANEAARRFHSTPCHLIDFVLEPQKSLTFNDDRPSHLDEDYEHKDELI